MQNLSMMIKPVSGLCNMRCRYCFYRDEMERRRESMLPPMSRETMETLVRRAMEEAGGSVSFVFQGGEPTLAGLDFFQAFADAERRWNTRGVKVYHSLQTNGYGLSDEMIAFFAREKYLLGVSLDGGPSTHDALRLDGAEQGTFRKVRQTCRRLRQAGVEMNILCVVTEQVARRPLETFETLRNYGYLQFIPCLDGLDQEQTSFSLTPQSYLAFLKTTFDLYERSVWQGKPVSVRNFDNYIAMLLGRPPENCGMSGRCGHYYLIESNGDVYPCDFYVLDGYKLGNIRDSSFAQLAQSPIGLRFVEESIPLPEECRQCRWLSLCRNGCKRERQNGRSRWCQVYQDFFAYSYERMKRLAQLAAK